MNKKLGHNVSAVTAPTLNFIKDTSTKTGISESAIEQDIRIASRLSDEEKEILENKNIGKKEALKMMEVLRAINIIKWSRDLIP
jgi:hypothetical protein